MKCREKSFDRIATACHSKPLMEPLKSDVLLSPTQAAAYLGISVATVIRWANTGRLPVVRSGAGHRRFYLSVIEDFRAKGLNEPERAKQHSPVREGEAEAATG